jgi:hypothetical protein
MFGLTDAQLMYVVVFVSILVLAYQVNELRTARKPRLKPSVLKSLFEAEPITVRHDTPRSLTPQGEESWAEPYDHECFQWFWYFADSINEMYSSLSEPIRLQELRDTRIRGSLDRGSPAYGRRYDIYYNQCKIGLLQIRASLDRYRNPENKSVDVEIVLDPPAMLPTQMCPVSCNTSRALSPVPRGPSIPLKRRKTPQSTPMPCPKSGRKS